MLAALTDLLGSLAEAQLRSTFLRDEGPTVAMLGDFNDDEDLGEITQKHLPAEILVKHWWATYMVLKSGEQRQITLAPSFPRRPYTVTRGRSQQTQADSTIL